MGWPDDPDDGVDGLHRLLLRSPALLYMFLIVCSTVSWVLIVQRIFVPNVLPTLFWVVDLLLVTWFWLSHLRYRIRFPKRDTSMRNDQRHGASASAYLYL